MAKKKPFSEALLEFIKANPGEIFTFTPEQLAERTGYSVDEARDYYAGVAAEKRRRAEQEEGARIRAGEADAIMYIPSSQHVRITYYPHLGEVKIESTYQRKRKFTRNDEWRADKQDNRSILLSPQDSIEVGIYLSGLQPHIRDTQARIAAEPEPSEPELPETYLPPLTPPDKMRLSDFARKHGISATQAVKYFDRHLIAGEREQDRWSGRTVDSVFIYSQGQRDAWNQLHELPGFRSCPQYPHEVEEDEEQTTIEITPSKLEEEEA